MLYSIALHAQQGAAGQSVRQKGNKAGEKGKVKCHPGDWYVLLFRKVRIKNILSGDLPGHM